jgi:hypothetical protein
MLTMSFKDFFETEWSEGEHELYILKRNAEPIYVGITVRGIWNRWFDSRGHMPRNGWGEFFNGSQVGRAVIENFPESWGWEMELWTLDDCIRFLGEEVDGLRLEIRHTEKLMIDKLKPSLNFRDALHYHKDTSDLIDTSRLQQKAHRELYG